MDVDDTDLSMEEALNRRLVSAARLLLSPAQIGLCRLVIAEGARHPELANAFHRAGPGRGATSLERWLATQAESGRLEFEDVKRTARLLIGMSFGAAHIKLLLRVEDAPTQPELEDTIRQAVRIFLRGAMPAAGHDTSGPPTGQRPSL
jgi:hypothetical protein